MFSNLVIIELASVLAGPSASMFFAELGAKVIKIENPHTGGDVTRNWKLPSEDTGNDVSAYFSCANWGKYSVGLDISSPEGNALINKLLTKADIVISSYKAGDAEKLNMDYDSVKAINPSIIYASLTGYGKDNPKTAYDAVLQAETGFMSMNGNADTGPLKMPVALIDVIASHQLKEGILLALIKRSQSGEGSQVEVSLYASAISSLANQAANYFFSGESPLAAGSEHPNIAPYGEAFKTHDNRQIILAVGNDKQFMALCGILKIMDTRNFLTNQLRLKNREVLKLMLAEKIRPWKADELMEQLTVAHIPAGIVRDVGEALNTPEAEEMHLKGSGLKGVSQLAFMDSKKKDIKAPPHFGADTLDILSAETGISEHELTDLQNRKIIFAKN